MNISLITPKFYSAPQNSRNSHYSNTVMPSKLTPLKADTVSFSANPMYRMEEALRLSYDQKLPLYRSMGVKLMDTLKVIADKYASRGVSFDEEYCSPAIVKSTDSFVEKIIRSGESLDRVRTTLFVDNPYDFKLIRDILDDLELRNYAVKPIHGKVNGKKVSIPDFDIRLGGVTQEDTAVLGTALQKCIGKPQKSGYEDIQMRLVDTNLTRKDAPPLELIMLYGKNYAEAKHNESYYSYGIRRIMSNLLHVAKVEAPKNNTPAYRIQNNIDIISGILENNIARPLFYNAKNKDYFHDEALAMPVELTKGNCDVLTGLLNGISQKIPMHYRQEAARVKSDEYQPILEKLIMLTPEFKERENPIIFASDIRKMRRSELARLKTEKAEDLDVMVKVRERMNETIAKYGKDS